MQSTIHLQSNGQFSAPPLTPPASPQNERVSQSEENPYAPSAPSLELLNASEITKGGPTKDCPLTAQSNFISRTTYYSSVAPTPRYFVPLPPNTPLKLQAPVPIYGAVTYPTLTHRPDMIYVRPNNFNCSSRSAQNKGCCSCQYVFRLAFLCVALSVFFYTVRSLISTFHQESS